MREPKRSNGDPLARDAGDAAWRLDVASILENITDAFIALDTQGRLTFVNRQAERFFRRGREDLLGQNLWSTFPEAATSPLYKQFRRIVDEGASVEFELFYVPAGRWLEIRAYPAEDGPVAYFRDITRRKQAEEERARLLAQEQAARAAAEAAIRARNDFLSGVTHDLKNPLTTIRGSVQALALRLAKGQHPQKDKLVEGLARIDGATTKMISQLDSLLDLSRLQVGRPLELSRREMDLVDLVREVAQDAAETTARHAIHVRTDLDSLPGEWDPARLERAIANLVANAIKYSPNGGDIVVEVDRLDEAEGASAVVQVRDPGVGIPADELPRVFEPFYRGASVATVVQGTGVGLASARQIVEEHGGSIAAESRVGAGSTFTVRLPITDREAAGSR